MRWLPNQKNVETGRFTFTHNVSQFTMFDSYLPQYEMAFKQGQASGAMCSYFGPNGASVCGNPWLLNGMIRGDAPGWGRPDAVVESDCSAVGNMIKNHYAANKTDASAKALNAGMDLYGGWGDDLWTEGDLETAIGAGMATTKTLDAAVKRTTMHKMKMGLFDPPLNTTAAGDTDTATDTDAATPADWRTLGPEAIDSAQTQQVAYGKFLV